MSSSSDYHQYSMGTKLGVLSCLYLSQGLPFGFFSQALPPLLRSYGVSLEIIGLVSFLFFPWALKFLWSPYVDQYGSQRLGRRKSWILPLQGVFVVLMLLIALIDPGTLTGTGLYYLAGLLFLAGFATATQDIATDGLAVQTLSPQERGLGNSIQVGGYRVGMVFGGGGVLFLMDRIGWSHTFVLLALVLAFATVPVLFFKEKSDFPVKGEGGVANIWDIFRRFMRQPGMWRWMLVVMLYKVGDSFGSAMSKPMLVDMNVSLETIGWVSAGVGVTATVAGAVMGGLLLPLLGRVRSLVIFASLQALSLLGYGWLSMGNVDVQSIIIVSVAEHLTGGMATVALFALMMDACRPNVAGTDYTVQASLQAAIGGLFHMISGFFAVWWGYQVHFAVASVMGLLILIPVFFWAKDVPINQRRAWQNSAD
ncbi:hypothetical protein A9Q99_20865 [Gammaproteobacteria bacterium 45_16_T64]|mgnify:CR=1 FL=1|nr:hypothetical protein A9Q99_20865 [Gammaproteobacteria bacterium 45_16_T64]